MSGVWCPGVRCPVSGVSGVSGASGVWGPVSGARPARARAPPPQDHEGISESSLREHEEVTKVKNVNILELGGTP